MSQTLPARKHPRGGQGPVAVVIEGICALVALCAVVAGFAASVVLVAVRLVGALGS